VFDGYSGLETAHIVFSMLAFLFMLGSFSGWVIEVFFRRLFSAKQWINPGFLTGPCLPIYGLGVVTLYSLSMLKEANPVPSSVSGGGIIWGLIIVLLIGVAMTLIELIGGLIFIKGLNLRLWDYSNRKGNFKGVICPLFSVIWTAVGALFYFLLYPLLTKTVSWFFRNYFLIFFVGMYFGIMIIDLCHAFGIAAKLKKSAVKKRIVIKIENLKASVAKHLKERNLKANFIFPFKSPLGLENHIDEYLDEEDENSSEVIK